MDSSSSNSLGGNSFLPLIVAAAVGAGVAVASSYFVHLYVSRQMEFQEGYLRRSMARELRARKKGSSRRDLATLSEDEEEDARGEGAEADRRHPHRQTAPQQSQPHPHPQGNNSNTNSSHISRMPPKSLTVPSQAHHLMHRQIVAASDTRAFSPTNVPRFLSPSASQHDLQTLTVPALNIAAAAAGNNPLLHSRSVLSPPTAPSALQEVGIPVRGVSIQSARAPDEDNEDEDEMLVNEEEEDELQEEAFRAEEALIQKQRQISENRLSPPLGPGIAGQDLARGLSPSVSFAQIQTAVANGIPLESMVGAVGVAKSVDGAADGPKGAVLHGISVMQDNVHHPVSDPQSADLLRSEPEQEDFVRVNVAPLDQPSKEDIEALHLIQQCLELREKYVFREQVPVWRRDKAALPVVDPEDPFKYTPEAASKHVFKMVDGVVRVYEDLAGAESNQELFPVWDATTFFTDMHHVLRITSMGPVRTLSFYRLKLLEQKFHLHLLLNADREFCAQKSAPHRDLYNVRKVDTHVHHSACMNQKHLLRFIKSKLRKEPDEVVIFRDGKFLTLKEVFESLNLTSYDLNVDLLDVHADKNIFHRFDKFNLKYNPCGVSRLREIFIKQENLIQGRFLAELTQEVFSDLKASKYQMAEYRISIYGRKKSEWDHLASWAINNNLYCQNVVWLIQLPRLYNVYKDMGIMDSFQVMLDNIFLPLFEVTVDPASHPQLHVFLKHVVGFDMVDDESKNERRPTKHMPTPAEWKNPFNPAYAYYTYYCYANLYTLNKLRESKNMSLLRFRPHCGEAGDLDHLAASFLTVHNIAHGNNLRRTPALQYLYYLSQIGLAMSPLSNNSLFLDYHKNPFPLFFARGMNVSLSTDDPLMIHLTKEPLVEEYSIAAQVWRLSSCDLCEVARNSVYQSGFSHPDKEHWIGPLYFKRGAMGNNIHNTNVPHIRMEFRHEVWRTEMNYVFLGNLEISDEIDH